MKSQGAPHSTSDNHLPDTSDSRSQHGHRHSAIPALFRHKPSLRPGQQSKDINETVKRMDHLKKQSYNLLAVTNPNTQPSPSASSSRRRFVSMPQALPSKNQTKTDIIDDRISRDLASPPLVDFTRFEDTYRAPRTGNFEGLMISTSRSNGRIRSSSSQFQPQLKARAPSMSTSGATFASQSTESQSSPEAADQRKPDPRLVLSSLSDILGSTHHVNGRLDVHELLAAHQLDQLDFEERGTAKFSILETGRADDKGRQRPLVVLGEPLRKSWAYSSTTHVLGGREHELPVLVVNCVEELYRTGIYQPNLFRTLPNRFRLLELINIFDSEDQLPGSVIRSRQRASTHNVHPRAGFGFNTSLHLESTPDICALLTTYLSSLPEPILLPHLFPIIWEWCDIGHDEEEVVKQQDMFGSRSVPTPLARSCTNKAESTYVLVAQLLLHLLPSPNFSLLVYLLAFFSQVALVKDENGVGIQDLSRMFGARLFGSGIDGSSSTGKGKGKARDNGHDDAANSGTSSNKGEKMMCWFLRRWTPIFEGLFDVVEEAKMGMFRPPAMRKDSLGKDVLAAWHAQAPACEDDVGSTDGGDREKDDGDGAQDVSFVVLPSVKSMRSPHQAHPEGSGSSGTTPIPRICIQASPPGPQDHSTPKQIPSKRRGSLARAASSSKVSEAESPDDFVLVNPAISTSDPIAASAISRSRVAVGSADETLDVAQLYSKSLSSSTYPGSPEPRVDEQLLDVSMPALMADQTLPSTLTGPSEGRPSFQTTSVARTYADRGVQTAFQGLGSPQFGTMTSSNPRSSRLDESHLRKTLQIIEELEKQLKDRTECLTDSLKDLARCKLELEACRRREQVRDLEKRFF